MDKFEDIKDKLTLDELKEISKNVSSYLDKIVVFILFVACLSIFYPVFLIFEVILFIVFFAISRRTRWIKKEMIKRMRKRKTVK